MTCLFSMAMAQDGGLSFVSKFASTAPTIDGVLASGEWDGALTIEIDATDEIPPGVVSADSSPIDPPGIQTRDDFNATIYVMNDATNLYVAVDVHDDVLVFSKSALHQNDSAEVRVDGNFSRLNPKEGNDLGYSANIRGDNGDNSGLPTGGVAVAAPKSDNSGWVAEYSLPIAGFVETIGFDVGINDSDDPAASNRDSQIRINALSDSGWEDESQWARLTLAQSSHTKNWEAMN
jgi:hypothetical protein